MNGRESLKPLHDSGMAHTAELIRFGTALQQGGESHHRELLTTQKSLDSLLAQLDSQESELIRRLDRLELFLTLISEPITAPEPVQKLTTVNSSTATDEIVVGKKSHEDISEHVRRLWSETGKLREGQDRIAELSSDIADKLSKVEEIVTRSPDPGGYPDKTALFIASAAIGLLITNLLIISKLRRTEGTRMSVTYSNPTKLA